MSVHQFPSPFPGPLVTRADVALAIEGLIGLLDDWDGDPDLEPDADLELSGDEQDTSNAEDELLCGIRPGMLWGPGCPLCDDDRDEGA